MSIHRKILAFVLAVLQVWVPAALEWQGATAAADVVVQHAGDGQTFAGSIVRSQSRTIQNTTIVNRHVDQASATDFSPNGGQLNLQEFGLGGDINGASQTLQEAYSNPERLNEIAKQAKRNLQARGCPSTSFEFERSAVVLTIQPIKVTLTKELNGQVSRVESIDTNYAGKVNVAYPTIGYMKSFDQVITAPLVGTPGIVLRYQATPFSVPNDGSFISYNHRVLGSQGNPVVTDYGRQANGYATAALVYMSPGSTVSVTADLYRVKRVYTPAGVSACPADPPSCIVSGLNFCGPPGLGIFDAYQPLKSHKAGAIGTLMDAVSTIEYSDTDANMVPILSRGSNVLDGSDPVFTQVFTGCSETANFDTNTITVHKQNIRTCSMPLVDLPVTCNGSRGTRFIYLQEAAVITASFFKRIHIPIIDPITGKQVLDIQGNPIFNEQDTPIVYSGPVGIDFPMFGGAQYITSQPDTDGYFVKYDLTPFALSPSEYFPYDLNAVSDGSATISVSSLGKKGDNWRISGSAYVSDATQMVVTAKLYQVMNNNIVGCEDYLKHAADGFCKAQMECTDNRGPCTTLDGVRFCESGGTEGIVELLRPWGIDDSATGGGKLGNGTIGGGAKEYLPKMCWQGVGTKMDCSEALSGQLNCYTDVNGVSRCGSADISNLATNFGEGPTHKDDCAAPGIALFGNPECRLISTNICAEGGAGLFSGTCYNRTVVYDCGKDALVTVPGGVSYSQMCSSPIRCMGTECHNPKGEVNKDFGRAVASSNIADMAAKDMVCSETGSAPTSTTQYCSPLIFNGEMTTCKIPVGNGIGITPNCCQESEAVAAAAPDAALYLQTIMYTYKIASDQMMMTAIAKIPGLDGFASSIYSSAGGIQTAIDGAISTTKGFLVDGASTIAKSFGYEISSPAASNLAKDFVLDTANAGLTQAQMASYYEFLVKNGMEDLASELFVQTTAEGGTSYALSESGQQLFTMVEAVSTVLMVYAIAKLIGHIVFKCEKLELQLGVQKKQGLCHYVGSYCAKKASGVGCIQKNESYCCYKSPLARMVSEQIRTKAPLVAGPYGLPSAPHCEGFTPAQLTAFDWSLFDPSEWISLLQEAGLIPGGNASADDKWGLTSSRAALAAGSSAVRGEVNIQDLTVKRYQPLVETYTQRREALAGQPVCYNSPTEMPWYQKTVTSSDVLRASGGTGRVVSCGDGCIDVYLGEVGDNYIHDRCTRGFDQYFDLIVDMPEFIQSAQLMEAQWDDHIQVSIGDSIVYQSPGFGNPPPVCELNRSWCMGEKTAGGDCSASPSNDPGGPIDVTHAFKTKGLVSTNTRVWVGGEGEGFARVRILWSVPKPGQGNCIYPNGMETAQ